MEYIEKCLGYTYSTELEAKAARLKANEYYLPDQIPSDVTRWWCNYQYNTGVAFWYIIYDDSLDEVFGTASEFDIIVNFP